MITELNPARRALLPAIALMLLGCVTEQANATNALTDPPQRLVELGDLDLNQSIDIEKLHRRITQAAREVCRTSGVLATLRRGRMHQCTRETVAHAVAQLNLPGLNAHHQRTLLNSEASASAGRDSVRAR